MSFIPWCIGNKEAATGVLNNVFFYRSYNNYPLLAALLKQLGVKETYYFIIFIVLIIITGIISRKMIIKDSFLLYAASLVAFSSAIANQYLIIPLIALAAYHRKVFYWGYTIIGSVYFVLNQNELHLAERFANRFNGADDFIMKYAEEGGMAVTLMTIVLLIFIIVFVKDRYNQKRGRSC